MHADSFFRMGATHAVCQDYAKAGQVGGVTFAALSDGCSGSPDTDYGARFLVHAAARRAWAAADSQFDPHGLIQSAAVMSDACELSRRALDATLLVAATIGEFVHVFQTGDGVIAARTRGGGFSYWSKEYSKSAPLYLSYLLSENDRAGFYALGQKLTHTSFYSDSGKSYTFNLDPIVYDHMIFPRREFDIVLLLSDGADSFMTKTGQHVPLAQVLDLVFNFKNYAGEFIRRRCSRFLATAAADGWRHEDDFSCAGIYLGDQ